MKPFSVIDEYWDSNKYSDTIKKFKEIEARRVGPQVTCILDGKPHRGDLPANVVFIGMEKEPNKPPRYGELWHPWHNLPCYVTNTEKDK